LLRALRDGVEFEIREVYTGWAAPWFKPLLPDLQSAFEHFAVALKRRAESGAPPAAGPVASEVAASQ